MTGFSPTRMIGGRYVVLGSIGSTGVGAVWRAADRVTGLQVAVAELHLPSDPEERRLARERLLRVARAAGRLRHVGFIPIHDVVTDGFRELEAGRWGADQFPSPLPGSDRA